MMRYGLRLAGLVGVFGFFAAGPAWGADHVPDWVKAASAAALPHYSETTRAVVLLDETTYSVDAKGQAVEHVRRVVKILRPQGRDLAYPVVPFNKDSKVLSMHVWSIDPAGHEYAMKDNEIAEVSPDEFSGELYSDLKLKVAAPPGRDPGGIVAYEYEKSQLPYLAETNWNFQEEIPTLKEIFTLVLPAGFSYTTSWANHQKVEGADLENHSYRWEMDNQPGIDLENVPLSPSAVSLAGRMTVHYSGPGLVEPQDGTWQGLGVWMDGLAKDRTLASPEIAAKAKELTAGKTDFYDRALAIGEFVQKQIRYVAIEVGVGGNQPHSAADIFRGRYGDCKDKSTLLAAMLSSIGLHSDLVMVDTHRGVVNPEAPSSEGNHMISAIEIPAGYESPKLHSVVTAKSGKRYLIFDPTWEMIPFGQIENNLQGSYGVLVEGQSSQLIQIPLMSPELNIIHRTASFQLSADGSLKGSVVDKRFGDLAERRRTLFTREDAKKQQEYMDRTVAPDLMAASLTGLKAENANDLGKDLTTSFDVNTAHFASATGPLLMVRPRVLGSYALEIDHKPRTVIIDLEETMQGKDEYDIALPEGYVVDELPDPVKEDFGFAAYESKTELRGNSLHYSRTFTVREVTLPPEKYSEVQRLARVIAADEDSRAVLKRGK